MKMVKCIRGHKYNAEKFNMCPHCASMEVEEKLVEPLGEMQEDVDTDGLNYLAGRTVDYINKQAMNGTVLAHVDGEIPNMMITLPYMSEFNLGELFYFFEFACRIFYVFC